MITPQNIENESPHDHLTNEYLAALDHQLDQLTALISKGSIDAETAKNLQQRLEQALNAATNNNDRVKDEFSILLARPQSTGRLIKLYLQGESISNFVLIALSLVMIILGLGMIIMPAPPFFEMFTIFYFNRDDGITVMDLISLIIILAGVYFMIKGIYKNPSLKKYTERRSPDKSKKLV